MTRRIVKVVPLGMGENGLAGPTLCCVVMSGVKRFVINMKLEEQYTHTRRKHMFSA